MAGVCWREADGLRYLHVDYRGADATRMLEVARESVPELEAAPAGACVLVDVTDAPIRREWLGLVKKVNHDVMGPRRMRCAVLGVSGVKAAMLRGFNAASDVKTLPFPSQTAALAWLRG